MDSGSAYEESSDAGRSDRSASHDQSKTTNLMSHGPRERSRPREVGRMLLTSGAGRVTMNSPLTGIGLTPDRSTSDDSSTELERDQLRRDATELGNDSSKNS